MTDDPTDSALIAASWADPHHFDPVFRRHFGAVYAFTVKAVGPSDGPDLAAEVFVRAFDVRRRFDLAYASARPWLFGIAANLIAGHFRSRAREHRALERLDRSSRADTFESEALDRVQASSISADLRRALALLRKEEAEVVCLFALADFSYKEIASALNISEGTVRSRLSRARVKLRNLLGSPGELDGT